MPLYIGDYFADTIGLTLPEHGAYLLSIMAYWRKRGPLTQAEMDSICNSHCNRVCQFFVRESVEGLIFWRHKRIERELLEANHRKANECKRTEAARAALEAKRASVTGIVTNSSSPSPSPSGKKERRSFEKPTVESVRLLASKSGLPEVEADKFFYHYDSKGWKVGRDPMVSLKSALAGWKTRWQANGAQPQQAGGFD